MRHLAALALLAVVGIAATGCCCPLGLLTSCIPTNLASAQSAPMTALSAVDRAQLAEIPATVPVAHVGQRF